MDARIITPRHAKTRQFTASGLFRDLDSFAELEDRIARLPTPQGRGAAFEVFAEGYIATQKSLQVEEVWPEGTIPQSILRKFKLPPKDLGVDGVIRTLSNEHHGYQVKFRTGRPSLTWDELSTFMGLTDEVDQRVLFTNCDTLPKVMQDRRDFFPIRGNNLDRLTTSDLRAIAKWLDTGTFQLERKTPLSHQEEAIENIISGLQADDRVTSIMACGTGKTLVALWLAERMASRTILVLVPSLALVRQTLHEWLKETQWSKPRFLCVCSDPAVVKGADQIVIHQSDTDFPVSTKASEVREFLRNGGGDTQIVFSTYQSAQVVADAMKGLPPFELGIFDEAHKTAGREGTRFSFALNDDNLPIKKRVFLTATPRHYDLSKRDKEGDSKLVYSMDVLETYGSRVHELTFAEAAHREIICDYKIIISIATSDMVNEELLRLGQVIVEGDEVKARQVANQIALKEACDKYDLKKIFTFHRSVASAASFTGTGGQSISAHLPNFGTFHVNGTMNTALREGYMKEFKEADRAVISNARCLTEGVDVPAVDMVAFLSPKKSKVDIVQATGRAMRRPHGSDKQFGYVMLPLYLEQAADESLEDAIERTDFGEVWNVLQAMQEQDTELADIIRQMREERGRTKGFDDSLLSEKVEVLGPEISLEAMRSSITAAIVEKLGITWDERFGELVAYKETHGNFNVPARWPENPKLGSWVNTQRTRKMNGTLGVDRQSTLTEIGFIWDHFEVQWEEFFAALKDYKRRQGDSNVPMGFSENPKLGSWVNTQRTQKKRGDLNAERFARLDSLDFVWDPTKAKWEEMFSALADYKRQHGDCLLPEDWPKNPKLGKWVGKQRTRKRKDGLSAEQVGRLDSLDFTWNSLEAQWEEMFLALADYRRQHGNCNVPKEWPKNPKLGSWVGRQRMMKMKGKLNNERFARLDSLDFTWNSLEARWEEMFSALTAYKRRHDDSNVPNKWSENPQLGRWVMTQRRKKVVRSLSEDRVVRLDSLDFTWNSLEALWEEMFAALKAYKKQHGDCNVPRGSKNPKLGSWVETQRRQKKKGKLSTNRKARLEELGFLYSVPFEPKGKWT